jgi:hypothetical protein
MGRTVKKGGKYKPTVQVTRDAKDALATWIEEHDRPAQSLIVGKVLLWFLGRPQPVQRIILGGVDEGMENAYADCLDEMAQSLREMPQNPTRAVHSLPRRKMGTLAVVDD